jgi:CrcB protein
MILLALAVAVAGGLGAAARFLVDGAISSRRRSAVRVGAVPIGIMLINISGSLLLGLVAGLAVHVLPEEWRVILGTGFLGGYTTFSTAAYDTVVLLQARKTNAAMITGLGMLIFSVAAAFAGYALGLAL